MQVLDRTGVGTLWSICKTKFALKDHSHNYLPLSGGTLTGDLLFSNSGTTFRQIRGTCGDNDFWRIGGGATGNNAGYMEIATADDGAEPIYVRQYSGTFSTITRTATLLDGSGNTSFPGTVAAAKFKGALEGNASTASNASTVNGHTVNANVPSNAKFTDTNTWRPIQDNLTSSSTSDSLSANLGRVLKGLVDGKANSSHTHNWSLISGAPATATRWPSWGEVTSKPDLKSWSETKSYIDNKAASSGGVDSLPAGTLLRSYNNKNIFGDNWKLADGSSVVANLLHDLQDTIESNANIIKETKLNVVEFNKYSLYYTRAACNFGGKFYVVNRMSLDSYTYATLFIIDENSCTSHRIDSTPYEGQYSILVNNEDIFIFVKIQDSLIVYYSKNGSNIEFTEIDLGVYDTGIDTNDNTLNSFSMIGGGKAIAVYSPKSQYDSLIVFLIYNGKYQRISDKFKKNISLLGWLNGACYCTIDRSIYKISRDYNISKVFTGDNNITSLGLVFYSNYCIILNYASSIYYTKDFNTYTQYSGNYDFIDFNIYRSLVYMNGVNNGSPGFKRSYFTQKVNNTYITISFDNSEDYIAIGFLVKNDNMYFLTMNLNSNTFRIYKMHIPIGSKVLPNMPDTYIKVK